MLDKKVKLYVPSTTEVSEVNTDLQAFFTKEALGLFSEEFGGATVYKVQGAWKSESGEIVTEDINIIESFYETLKESTLDKLNALAANIKIEMTQEAVSLEINNQLNFI